MAATCKSTVTVDRQIDEPDRTTVLKLTKSHILKKGSEFKVTSSADPAAVMMQVETAHIGFRNLRSLRFLDASQRPMITVEQVGKGHLRSWGAFRGDCTSESNRLFLAVDKTCFFQMGLTVHVFLDGDSSGDRAPDFVVSGSYYIGSMTVSRGDKDTAIIERKRTLLGENSYTVRINHGVDQALVLALTVVLDQMYELRCCACYRH